MSTATPGSTPQPLSRTARWAVLTAAFAGLVLAGFELALMPVAALSVSKSLLGAAYTDALGGEWFARFTASLMLGMAFGGILMGNLGDRIGRTRAMGTSIVFYALCSGLGGFAQAQEEMLVLRFFVGLGLGGVWPNAVVLVSECWPSASRPVVAGVMGAGINFGILLLSQLVRFVHITPDSWRWIFWLAGLQAILGLIVFFGLPESPKWLASRARRKMIPSPVPTGGGTLSIPSKDNVMGRASNPSILRELFRPPLLWVTAVGIVLASIPLVGAWAASKWMIPWADKVATAQDPGYKAVVQGWWALGATLGSFLGAQVAAWLGRRRAYFLIALGATVLTISMFQLTAPLRPSFLPVVFAQGFVATLFFGWLPLYLPELFPTHVRATGAGVAMNTGRFATAAGVLMSGILFSALGGSYPAVGTLAAFIYALGMIVIWFAPDTSRKNLDD